MSHYNSGEEKNTNIKWYVDLNPTTQEWIVTATNNMETKTEIFKWQHAPTFGIDTTDLYRIETTLDNLIEQLKPKKKNNPLRKLINKLLNKL